MKAKIRSALVSSFATAVLIIGALSVFADAPESGESGEATSPEAPAFTAETPPEIPVFPAPPEKPPLAEANSKWDALTDEQKDEIYGLEDKKAALDKEIVDKYAEFGIIDSETADKAKEAIDERNGKMREDGGMPGGPGVFGGPGRPGCKSGKHGGKFKGEFGGFNADAATGGENSPAV